MKKLLALVLAFAFCLSLCACGGSNKGSNTDTDKENTTEAAGSSQVETIDFSVEKGSIKYVGIEKANDGLVDNPENVYMLKFEYTNEQSAPAQCQSTFYIQAFQNGVELDNSSSYSSAGGDQYEVVGNFHSEVMKGGSVTFGRLVEVQDNSPVTVMVKERDNNDNYQMMEVALSAEGGSSDEAGASDEGEAGTAEGIWEVNYYVDDFNQPTDEWYIANKTSFLGTFSNSATTDSTLTVDMLVDCENYVAFFLYEYGRNTVKNSSQNYVDNYDITMRTADGTDHNLTGTLYCGGDRIIIDDAYVNTVLEALKTDGNVMFRVVKSDRTVESYLFTVIPSNFDSLYTAQTAA